MGIGTRAPKENVRPYRIEKYARKSMEGKTMTDQSETDTEHPGTHLCECSRDCGTTFEADTIGDLAKKVARHMNREHSSSLRRHYEMFDSEEIGGHRIKDDIYEVRKLKHYVTAYDMLSGGAQALDESFAVPSDPACCTDCWRYTATSEVDAVELDSKGIWGCKVRCEFCHDGPTDTDEERERPDYEKESELSYQLGDFPGGESA